LEFVYLAAIQNDDDIRVIDEEIAELARLNGVQESRISALREQVAAAESHAKLQDAELAILEATVDKTESLLSTLRSSLQERLSNLNLHGDDDKNDDTISIDDIDAYVAKLSDMCRQQDSAMPVIDGALKEALAGLELV